MKKTSQQIWRDKNPEKIKEYSSQYYKNHTEEQKARVKDWEARNPEKVKEIRKRKTARQKQRRQVDKTYREKHLEYRRGFQEVTLPGAVNNNQRWTVEDLRFLEEHLNHPHAVLAAALNRTLYSIRSMSKQISKRIAASKSLTPPADFQI
jgi:hypothetical protein